MSKSSYPSPQASSRLGTEESWRYCRSLYTRRPTVQGIEARPCWFGLNDLNARFVVFAPSLISSLSCREYIELCCKFVRDFSFPRQEKRLAWAPLQMGRVTLAPLLQVLAELNMHCSFLLLYRLHFGQFFPVSLTLFYLLYFDMNLQIHSYDFHLLSSTPNDNDSLQ